MKIIVGCEESQAVTIELRKLGHEAYSCDLEECSGGHPEWHIKCDVRKILRSGKWDLVIAFPPCTRLANSGVRWLVSKTPREGYVWCDRENIYMRDSKIWDELLDGISFFNAFVLYGKLGHKIAIENPIQHKYARRLIDKPVQTIQPYQFGHMEKKATCLWLYGLPKLTETNNVFNEMMELDYKDRAKTHYASPGPERSKLRSKTFPGIAKAMAEQWTGVI